jgi:hypothetical protein
LYRDKVIWRRKGWNKEATEHKRHQPRTSNLRLDLHKSHSFFGTSKLKRPIIWEPDSLIIGKCPSPVSAYPVMKSGEYNEFSNGVLTVGPDYQWPTLEKKRTDNQDWKGRHQKGMETK